MRYGKYLIPRYRDDIFLMTKTQAKDAATARQHLEGSLKRMNTDVIDLWQIHSLKSPEDADDRLARGVRRTNQIKEELKESGYTMPQLALKFAMSHEAVSTVIPGIRNQNQALQNTAVSDLPELPEDLLLKLREHTWNRGFWYGGK